MKRRMRRFITMIRFMQERLKAKVATRENKVEVIRQQWTNTLFRWFQKAAELKDEGMKELIKLIIDVKPAVREVLLQHYIRQCNKKYAIAFIQWRLHFSLARQRNESGT